MSEHAKASGSAPGASPKMTKPMDAKNIDELFDYMYDNYDVRMKKESFQDMDFEAVKIAAQGITDVMDEFPGAKDNFHELRADATIGDTAFAAANYDGYIKVNTNKYKDKAWLDRRYQNTIDNNTFHPVGTTSKEITSHEAGHILERALIDKYILSKGNSYWTQVEAIQAWNKHTIASKVISEAAKNAKKHPNSKGKKIDDLRREVSRYSMKTRGETLAECVADYVANRENAKPLSREVWKILKRELG